MINYLKFKMIFLFKISLKYSSLENKYFIWVFFLTLSLDSEIMRKLWVHELEKYHQNKINWDAIYYFQIN